MLIGIIAFIFYFMGMLAIAFENYFIGVFGILVFFGGIITSFVFNCIFIYKELIQKR